jgi:hypothetical protein
VVRKKHFLNDYIAELESDLTSIKLQDYRIIRKKKRQIKSSLGWSGFLVGVLTLIGFFIWQGVRPYVGEEVPIAENALDHIPLGDEPGSFDSDPPTSGNHFSQPLKAGFYEETDPETYNGHPLGYLLHNLEHGYIIFWYNCGALETLSECNRIKDQIQGVMDRFLNVKLIAFPWSSIDVPVVMTSWGYMQRYEKFDEEIAQKFIENNRNRAPEKYAP